MWTSSARRRPPASAFARDVLARLFEESDINQLPRPVYRGTDDPKSRTDDRSGVDTVLSSARGDHMLNEPTVWGTPCGHHRVSDAVPALRRRRSTDHGSTTDDSHFLSTRSAASPRVGVSTPAKGPKAPGVPSASTHSVVPGPQTASASQPSRARPHPTMPLRGQSNSPLPGDALGIDGKGNSVLE
jgi:hypothetical protein